MKLVILSFMLVCCPTFAMDGDDERKEDTTIEMELNGKVANLNACDVNIPFKAAPPNGLTIALAKKFLFDRKKRKEWSWGAVCCTGGSVTAIAWVSEIAWLSLAGLYCANHAWINTCLDRLPSANTGSDWVTDACCNYIPVKVDVVSQPQPTIAPATMTAGAPARALACAI